MNQYNNVYNVALMNDPLAKVFIIIMLNSDLARNM